MIQTSYVALEHPYRIIEYGGTVGLQIGTLVVTREMDGRDGSYGIETHSHPVVSYVNPQVPLEARQRPYFLLPEGDQTEGVVWDKVEVGSVHTLGREGDELSWERLMDLSRNYWLSEPSPISAMNMMRLGNLWSNLRGWGLTFGHVPVNAKGVMRLTVELVLVHHGQQPCAAGTVLGLAAAFNSEKELLSTLRMQAEVFKALIKGMELAKDVVLTYKSSEKQLKPAVVVLNMEEKLNRPLVSSAKKLGRMRFVVKKKKAGFEDVG